jgi:hypothetical protein
LFSPCLQKRSWHAELLLPGRRVVYVGIPDNPIEAISDRQVVVSMLHVQRLEPLMDTAKSPDNRQG